MSELLERIKDLPERERLFALIKEGSTEEVSLALSKGYKIKVSDDRGVTPLMAACIFRPAEPEFVQTLLAAKADIKAVTSGDSMTALAYACTNNATGELVRLLLDAGADIFSPMPEGKTVLHVAALLNVHEDVISQILERGGNPRQLDSQGWNSLHCAATGNSNPAIAELLVKAGVDLESKAADGRTALALAVSFNHPPVVEALIRLGADMQAKASNNTSHLMLAAMLDPRPELCQLLLKNGALVEDADDEGMTALHFAAARQTDSAVLRTLVSAGADINACSAKGFTPLMRAAAENGQSEIMLYLLEAGAQVASLDVFGSNALFHALMGDRDLPLIDLLLTHGANPELQLLSGETILHLAAAHCTKAEVMDRLLDLTPHGLVNQANSLGQTPLAFASMRENGLIMASILLAEGADPLVVDQDGNSPLIHAVVRSGSAALVDLLLDAGADPAQTDANGYSAYDHSQNVKTLWYTPQQMRLKAGAPAEGRWVPAHIKPGRKEPPMLAPPREKFQLPGGLPLWLFLMVLFALIRAISG